MVQQKPAHFAVLILATLVIVALMALLTMMAQTTAVRPADATLFAFLDSARGLVG